MAYSDRKRLWFGTASGGMDWFYTPLKGAEMHPEGWTTGGTLLSGGGYQQNSFGSHKTYTFEWPSSSSREAAALMKAYADGTYGRGLIYFIDPLIYDKNILPAQWADPSMVLDYEGASHVYGVNPTGSNTANWKTNRLPVRSVTYDLTNVTAGFRGQEDAVFIPIPQGYSLLLGAVYSSTGSGGVFASWQDSNGVIQSAQKLTSVSGTASGPTFLPDVAVQGEGVWLWVGKTATGASTVSLTSMIARLVKTEDLSSVGSSSVYGDGFYGQFAYGQGSSGGVTPPYIITARSGPWEPGMGHSGCRFIGKPTYIANTGVNGGRVSFAASFREVGSYLA